MNKHVLGLDLGVGSIGWSLITLDEQDNPAEIVAMGSRVVPLNAPNDANDFSIGKAFTANQDRTARRSMRRGFARYQLRRHRLHRELSKVGMLPDAQLIQLPLLELWELRERAAKAGEQLTLPELGRVLCHINQKRGYRHVKGDRSSSVVEEDKKKKETNSDYVTAINQRYAHLQEAHLTVGQYFAEQLRSSQTESGAIVYRVKDQVYPRQAYIDEYNQIMQVQSAYYPEVLTSHFIQMLRDEVIFMQRPLKSCKHLVSLCEFEKQEKVMRVQQDDGKGGKEVVERKIKFGPKVTPKSSPLFQLCRLYEAVNNIRLTYPDNSPRPLADEERTKLVAYLQGNEAATTSKKKKESTSEKPKKLTAPKLTDKVLKKLLKIKEELHADKLLESGITGDTMRVALASILQPYEQYHHLLTMELETRPMKVQITDEATGEITEHEVAVLTDSYTRQPLYRLWHILYSIEERDAMRKALITQLGMAEEDLDGGLLDRLYRLDFVKPGYGNKSAKFMCKLLPQLQQGLGYSEACAAVGYRHSVSLTREEIAERPLLPQIPLLQRNELRQPMVEKILNQMINLVNTLQAEYGIDEVRIELARELKMSREEREKISIANRSREKENKKIAEHIQECGFYPTKTRIRKYMMWKEAEHRCMYCGKEISLSQCMNGDEMEVEHIIPKSLLYDDSFGNKTCACRRCNKEKGNLTAREYIQSKGWEADYHKRLTDLLQKKRISYSKYQRLLWLKKDIPADFLERQLRLTQYISRQAMSILQQGIRRVAASEGGVTARLRSLWGYDDILHCLNLDRYESMGETELVPKHPNSEEDESMKCRITDWSKRKDHRHHAIDALVVACTQQGYIQRLNRLSSESDRDEMRQETELRKEPTADKLSLLERWLSQRPHFSVQDVSDKVAEILISYPKPKRTHTWGHNRYKKKTADGKEKTCIQTRVLVPRGELMEASLYGKIISNGEERIVKRYPLHALKGTVVDPRLRELITQREQGHTTEAKGTPLYLDAEKKQEVRSVRCYAAKLSTDKAIPLCYDEQGKAITFAKSGSNHHVAIYRTAQGELTESLVSFWDAVDQARYGLPLIIKHPREVAEQVLQREDIPEEVLRLLPPADYEFVDSFQQNEMVIVGLSDEELQRAIDQQDYRTLSEHLYRVQKITSKDYFFRYHLETGVSDCKNATGRIPKFHRVSSFKAYEEKKIHKVRIDLLGRITLL